MRPPVLFLDVESIVKNNDGVLSINQAIVDEFGRRYGRRDPAYVYLTANIPFQLSDEQLRDFYKMVLVAEDALSKKGLAVTAITTPYDVSQNTDLGDGFRYQIEPIAQCANDLRREQGLEAYAKLDNAPVISATERKSALLQYVYEQTKEIDAPYTIYLDASEADRAHLETTFRQQAQDSSRLFLSTDRTVAQPLQLNAEISRFLLAQKLQNDRAQVLDNIERFIESKIDGLAELNVRQRNRLTEFFKEVERLVDIAPADADATSSDLGVANFGQIKLLSDLLIDSISSAKDPSKLVVMIKQLTQQDIVSNLQLRKLNVVLGHFLLEFVAEHEAKYVSSDDEQANKLHADKLVDYFDLLLDMTHGHKSLVQTIQQSLQSIRTEEADKEKLLATYTLILSYMINPRDAGYQKKLIEKCSEFGQNEDKNWNQLSLPMAWLHLHASENEKVAELKTHQKIELCKTTLKRLQLGDGLLRKVVDDLLIKAQLMGNTADQLELLRTLEASINLLTEPDKKEVIEEFKKVTKRAQGKPSSLWRSIGAILATLSVIVALITIIALAAPIPVAAGMAVLLTVKTMFASHCAIAFGCAAAGASSSMVCFFNGSSKKMHQSMSKLNKVVHKSKVKAVLAG